MNSPLFHSITTNPVLAFVIGALSAFPSFAPTAIALKNAKSCDLYKKADLEGKLLWIPIFYGILHIVLFLLVNTFLPPVMRNYWTIGFLIGLIYPTFGTIGGYAKKIYGIESHYNLYLNAQVMYLLFYGVVINLMAYYICK